MSKKESVDDLGLELVDGLEEETPTPKEFNELDLDFFTEEVEREEKKKGRAESLRSVSAFPRGFFRCFVNFDAGLFTVETIDEKEFLENKGQPGYFDSWNQIRHCYISEGRARRKNNMKVIKKVINCHKEVLEIGKTK